MNKFGLCSKEKITRNRRCLSSSCNIRAGCFKAVRKVIWAIPIPQYMKIGVSFKTKNDETMKRKNILILGAALLMTAPALNATPDDNNDGVQQTLTVNEETVDRTVSEIRIDGNNAVLLLSDGTTLTADMRLVTLTMSYDEATGINEVKEVNGVNEVLPSGQAQAENDNSWYTLDGIKVTIKPKQKGIYIQNGKKVLNKNK